MWGALQYAIRPSIRNNNTWHRDEVIKLVADAVGTGHTVDLKNYDKLILVDVYRVSLWRPLLRAVHHSHGSD